MSANVESSTNESNDARNDEREATELQSYEQHAVRNAASVTTTVDDDNHSVRINRLKRQCPKSVLGSIRAFWKQQIAVTVSRDDCRDHFGRFVSIVSESVFYPILNSFPFRLLLSI